MTTFHLGGSVVVHHIVDPDVALAIPLDAEAAELVSGHEAELVPWAVSTDGQALLTTAAVGVETVDGRVLIDPFSAFAETDRSSEAASNEARRRVGILTDAGFGPSDVSAVVLTHIDGAGALTIPGDGVETPVYDVPHILSRGAATTARATHPAGRPSFDALDAAGLLEEVDDDHVLNRSMRLLATPAHGTGHCAVVIEGPSDTAVAVGHLFLHPAHVLDLSASAGDEHPQWLERDRTLALETAGHGLLVGDLFCSPGALRVSRRGDRWSLRPAA